jgi:membrane protease YdiL (CAAX protease family)
MKEATSPFAVVMPRWQVLLVFLGLPVIYVTNSFLPWSVGLFAHRDRDWYLPYLGSVAVLHWASTALVISFTWRAGGQLEDIGLDVSGRKLAMMAGLPVVVGAVFILFRENWLASRETATLPMIFPTTLGERVVWVFMSLTAGFCEELVYRGFGLRVLLGRGMHTWLAVLLTTLAYVLVHDLSGVFLFPLFFVVGLLFAWLFLWMRSLVPVVCLHALVNVSEILVS